MLFFDNNEIVSRLKTYPILSQFSRFELGKLVARSEVIELPAGDVLFHQGDPSDCVYYLMDGHLIGFSPESFKQSVVNIRSGEIIGELGVITGEPRSLSIQANRESRLLKVEKKLFLKLFRSNAELLFLLTQKITKRLQNTLSGLRETHYPYKNIAIVITTSRLDVEQIKTTFRSFVKNEEAHIYDKAVFESMKMEAVSFFYQCESYSGVNLFFSAYGDGHWLDETFDHADYVYFITLEDRDTIDSHWLESLRNRPCDIVIIHHQKGPYSRTAQFYEKYAFKRHHHIQDRREDYARLYRYMTGQAIGLVMSGGGFRGYAHCGLVKALFDAKVPIDAIGGSSVGAGIGAVLAIDFDWDFFEAFFMKCMKYIQKAISFFQLTYPEVSILSGEEATRLSQEFFGKYRIEDLPINYFCVTGNLSERLKELKKLGELWEWLRASTSIPGIVPPFEKDGNLYVDGAVCTNLPSEDMRDYLDNAGTIIALDIRTPPLGHTKFHFPPSLPMINLLMNKMGMSKGEYTFPKLVEILTESSSMSQYIQDTQDAKRVEIMIAPDTSSLSFFDGEKSAEQRFSSYGMALDILKEKEYLYKRWIEK